MLYTKLQPFILLFIFSAVSSLGWATPSHYEEKNNGMVSWSTQKHLLEATNAKPISQNSPLILAAERTHRKDPSNGFNYYKGGWNISEKHYFSSVGFSAAPLFIIGAIWFVGFGLCMLVIGLCQCFCQYQHYSHYSRTTYLLSLTFLAVFTITAIIGCVVLYLGQGKFHNETTKTLEYVVEEAESVVESLENVSTYLNASKNVGVAQFSLPANIKQRIDSVENKINASSTILQQGTGDNANRIRHFLDSVRVALIIFSAVMLLFALFGFGKLLIRRLNKLVVQCYFLLIKNKNHFTLSFSCFPLYRLVVIGWILVTVTLILGGVFLLLHNVVGDTCVAMDEWVRNPTSHSALDDILTCVDNATAQQTLYESKDVTFQLVSIVNLFITKVSNFDAPPQAGPTIYYNQSGPLVPILCNPFNSNITDRQCPSIELSFQNAQQEWKKYVCEVSVIEGICTSVGRLTPIYYDQLMAIVNVSSVLYNYGPFLVELGDCTFVRKTFMNISLNHCSGLRDNSRLIVIGLVLASAAVMLCLFLWVFFTKESKHGGYDKQTQQDSFSVDRKI
ncbi:uncharacterized protein LOC115704919 [Cannabis sativa]|uniref:uncharacterized protein LOC115704919 n=1 Tax=Cannabis sativa TaxID=3483 RepID=UPI0029CA21C2|nr:uncharacterized protein LOC115704919 [Cannabis sativa]